MIRRDQPWRLRIRHLFYIVELWLNGDGDWAADSS